MKKLVLLLAVVFGVSFVSCGDAEKTASVSDTDTVAQEVVDTAAADTAAADTAAAPADSAKAE